MHPVHLILGMVYTSTLINEHYILSYSGGGGGDGE